MEQDIEIRIQSLYIEFERYNCCLENEISWIRVKIANELNLVDEIQSKIIFFRNNKSDLKRFVILLKEYSSTKSNLDLICMPIFDSTRKLESYSVSKKKFPKNSKILLGSLCSPYLSISLRDMKRSTSVPIDLSEFITNLTSLCQVENGNFLALDNYLNSIVELSSKFKFIRSVYLNNLDGVRHSHLCYNSNFYGLVSSENLVYVNNMERNKILVLDNKLPKILNSS